MDEVKIPVTITGVDEATEKVKVLIEKIKEARTLAGELASCLGELEFNL